MTDTTAEFTIPQAYKTDRSSPARWIFSHGLRQWPILLLSLLGALGNAGLLAMINVKVGQAFNVVSAEVFDNRALVNITILILIFALVRGIFQFLRNFGFEFVAQRIERNVRRELYTNLLGKSMTFHNLQPVGDTMARATNDVREVNFLFSPGLNVAIGSIAFLIFPVVAAPRYDVELMIIPIAFIVLYFFTLRIYMRGLAPLTEEVRESFGALNIRLAESLDGVETRERFRAGTG